MNTPFSVTPTTNISVTSGLSSTALNSGGEKLVIRSSNSADTMNITILGALNGVTVTEVIALKGQIEVQMTQAIDTYYGGYLASNPAGTVTVLRPGTAAVGLIRCGGSSSNAVNDASTVTLGLTGHTQDYTFHGVSSLAAAYDVACVLTTSSTFGSDVASNMRLAIRAGDTAENDHKDEGLAYGPGTMANPYFEIVGSVENTTSGGVNYGVVHIQDRIPCARALGYSCSSSVAFTGTGASFDVYAPAGGVDGATLETLTTSGTVPGSGATTTVATTFDTEDLATKTLYASSTPTTDAIQIGTSSVDPRPVTLRFYTDAGSALTVKYQTSTNNVNWHDGAVTIPDLSTNSGFNQITTTENIEYIRLVFTGNSNVADKALDARVI